MNQRVYSQIVRERCDGLSQRQKTLTGTVSKRQLINRTTGLLNNPAVSSQGTTELLQALKNSNDLTNAVIGLRAYGKVSSNLATNIGAPVTPLMNEFRQVQVRNNQLREQDPDAIEFRDLNARAEQVQTQLSALLAGLNRSFPEGSDDTSSDAGTPSLSLSDYVGDVDTLAQREPLTTESTQIIENLRDAGEIDDDTAFEYISRIANAYVQVEDKARKDLFFQNLSRLSRDYKAGRLTSEEYLAENRRINETIENLAEFSPGRGTYYRDPREGSSATPLRPRTSAGAGPSNAVQTMETLQDNQEVDNELMQVVLAD